MIRRQVTQTLAERFWPKVNKSGACWVWMASTDKRTGYGWFSIRSKMVKAHRIAWTLANGPIPGGLHVLHRCDNPPCVNPDHLFLGTHQENMADHVAKGRTSGARGEANGKSVLNSEAVREIRQRIGAGHEQKKLAAEYGVDPRTISAIKTRAIWNAI